MVLLNKKYISWYSHNSVTSSKCSHKQLNAIGMGFTAAFTHNCILTTQQYTHHTPPPPPPTHTQNKVHYVFSVNVIKL